MTTKETTTTVLVNLRIRKFNNLRTDRSKAREIAEKYQAQITEDSYIKKRIPQQYLRSVERRVRDLYDTHRRYTVPWLDRGARVLPGKMALHYLQTMSGMKDDINDAVQRVANNLPAIDQETQKIRGQLYSPDDIPSAQDFLNAYDIDLTLIPMAPSEDFRLAGLSDKDQVHFGQKYEKFVHQAVGNQLPHLVSMYREPIDRLIKTSQSESPRYHESVYDRLQDIREVSLMMVDKEEDESTINKVNITLDQYVFCNTLEQIRKNQGAQEDFVRGLFQADKQLKEIENGFTSRRESS